MGKKNKYDKKRQRMKRRKKWLRSCEHKSDRRTAQFIARQLGEVQEQLCDLLADLRTFEHYSEIENASWCLRLLQGMKTRYHNFADNGVWEEV